MLQDSLQTKVFRKESLESSLLVVFSLVFLYMVRSISDQLLDLMSVSVPCVTLIYPDRGVLSCL